MSGESSEGRTQSESQAINDLHATVASSLSAPLCCPLYLYQAIKIYCDGLIDMVNMHVHSEYWETARVLENTQCKELFGYGKYNHFQTSTMQMVPLFFAPEQRESTHVNNEMHIRRHDAYV